MGTITRIHYHNIVEDLNDIEIRDLIRMLQIYLEEMEEEEL